MAKGKEFAPEPNKGVLSLRLKKGESQAEGLGRLMTAPELSATALTCEYGLSIFQGADLDALATRLEEQCKEVQGGDLSSLEAMLTAQAQTLSSIFYLTAQRARLNMGQHMEAADTYLRLALRSQAQCRATVQTLAEMKNPKPVAFVQQANFAHGHQQVNNGCAAPSHAREQTGFQPNELLENTHVTPMDTRTPGTAGRGDTALEAVGAIGRADH